MRPLLSLGIPTFNRAPYLDRLLSSLLEDVKQLTDKDFELLVRDNASTDNTTEVCERYAKLIPGFKYIRSPENEGAYKNGTAVQKTMSGQWIWMSGDDDFFKVGTILKLINEIKKDKCDIILLNRSQCDRDEAMVTESVIEGLGDCYFERLGGFASIPCSYEMIGFLGSALYKRDFIDTQDLGVYNLPSFFNHVSIIFETFGNRPMKYFAEPLMTQRLFNIRGGSAVDTTIDVSLKTGFSLLSELLLVQAREKMPAEELWAWSMRRAYGKSGGSISLLEWTINYLIKGPLMQGFGQIPDADYDMMFKFLTENGRGLPPAAYQTIYASFAAAVDGLKARRALITA